jgi:hypothetical protein
VREILAVISVFALFIFGILFVIDKAHDNFVAKCEAQGGKVRPHPYDGEAEACFVKGEMVDTFSVDD